MRKVNLSFVATTMLLAVMSLGLFQSCEGSRVVTYRNGVQQSIIVVYETEAPVEVAAGGSATVGLARYKGERRFQARTTGNVAVFDEALSWEELEAMNWAIIFK